MGSGVSPSYIRPFMMFSAIISGKVRSAIRAFSHIGDVAKSCVNQRSEDIATGKETRRDMLAQLFAILQEKGEKGHEKAEKFQWTEAEIVVDSNSAL